MELNEILKVAIKGGASDIHLKSGLPPMFRVDGALVPLKNGERILPDELQKIAFSIMNPIQKARFDENRECDLAYGIPGLGRFRVNVFQQRGTVGIVFRVIPFGVKTIEQLFLPKVIEKIARETGSELEIEVHRTLPPVLKGLRREGYQLVALEQTTGSRPLFEFRFERRTVLVVGNERAGVEEDVLKLVDHAVEIPVYGLPASHNAATAAAMAMYEYCRQHPLG